VVRHGALEDSRLVPWQLAPSRRLLVASSDYLARQGTPGTMDELQNHRGIFYINRGVADWRFQGQEGALVVRATVALRVNNGDMMRDAAVAGLGIALLPTFIAGAAIQSGALRGSTWAYRRQPSTSMWRTPRAGVHRPSCGHLLNA
jgi:DNA-binding transcriptional LysR family regulator